MSWSKRWSWIDDSWSGCGAVNVFFLVMSFGGNLIMWIHMLCLILMLLFLLSLTFDLWRHINYLLLNYISPVLWQWWMNILLSQNSSLTAQHYLWTSALITKQPLSLLLSWAITQLFSKLHDYKDTMQKLNEQWTCSFSIHHIVRRTACKKTSQS